MEVLAMTFVDELQKDILPYFSDQAATASLLKRIFLFLEDGEFIQADSYCEKVLDTEPENPVAYLCKLMASRRISSLKDLATAQYTIDNDGSYKKLVRFAPEQMQLHLHQLNMQIYDNSIKACRNRAKIHLAHGELKETAQVYQNAVKMWDDCHETLPNADVIYNDLANEIADFNWKLMLHNRQCPDDSQLIARSIPIDNDRWYLSAVKWADTEKKAYFTSVAKDTRFNTHLKCLEYIKSKQTRLAKIWADHYKASAPENDPLTQIHQALVDTDGFTKFSADAPGAMLDLIKFYKFSNPQIADDIKIILQEYYGKIFRSLLDFTGKESPVIKRNARLHEDDFAILIAQQEANACAPAGKTVPIPDFESPTEEVPATDPVWATQTAWKITEQMVTAIAEDLFPYSVVATYLVAAKELTIRYSKKDGIVTEPVLFRFICRYYTNAISQINPEQVCAIQSKFDDFLMDTVRLPSASAEIATDASAYMRGSALPYQIYLSHITNDYSVKSDELIPPEVTKGIEKWQKYLDGADPVHNCYRISDQQNAITAAFTVAEEAITNCRQYTTLLQKDLDTSYQQVLASSGDGQAELSSDWNQKMALLQDNCNTWADDLEGKLHQAQELNNSKLELAQKQIKIKEKRQTSLSVVLNLLLVFTIFVFGTILTFATNTAWNLMDTPFDIPRHIGFHIIHLLAPVIACILSLVNGMVAPTYDSKNRRKLLWLFTIFSMFTYVLVYLDIYAIIFSPITAGSANGTNIVFAGILALIAIVRTLLEFYLCKLRNHTRSNTAQAICKVGSTIAKVAGVAQWLVCLGLTALYVCCLLLIL